MQKRRLGSIIALTIVITAVVTFCLTTTIFGLERVIGASQFDKLGNALTALQRNFYKDVDMETLVEGAIRGAASSLEDPYTTYLNKSEWDNFNQQITGKFIGIGVVLSGRLDDEEKHIVVVSPIKGSPAEAAGIKTGDKIIKVEGENVYLDELDSVVSRLKGEANTEVNITILRATDNKEVDVKLKRAEIIIESVEYEKIGDIGYIQIYSFDEATDKDFNAAYDDLAKKGIKGLVIDLRYNGGGLVIPATNIADKFLSNGKTIVYTENRKGDREYIKATGKGIDIPIALIVNEGTASASEILAGALRDNDMAVIVGETSFGKGLVQNFLTFGDNTALKITTDRYFTPNGEDINKKGITPQIEVTIPAENYPIDTHDKDDQLQAAIKALKVKK